MLKKNKRASWAVLANILKKLPTFTSLQITADFYCSSFVFNSINMCANVRETSEALNEYANRNAWRTKYLCCFEEVLSEYIIKKYLNVNIGKVNVSRCFY